MVNPLIQVLVGSAENRPFPDTLARLLLFSEATLLNVTQAARVLLLHAARGRGVKIKVLTL